MTYAIRLADGRLIGLGRYVAAWRQCLALPPETPIGRGISGWGETAGEALVELRRGLDDRINRHLSWWQAGRKWRSDFQRHLRLAASAVNTPRLAVYRHNWPDICREYGTRLAHRFSDERDW